MGFDWNDLWRASRTGIDAVAASYGVHIPRGGGGGSIDRHAQPYVGGQGDIVPLVLIGVALFAIMRVKL